MLKVAILGANGFIGSRAVEMLHLAGFAEVRPVVRTVTGLASLARFDLEGRVADAFDRAALRRAFDGCEVVVYAIAGDRKTIIETAGTAYQAADEAGVRRLIYLSSASVHGQAPTPGTDESSPLSDRQPIDYNNSKVQAERKLLALRACSSAEVVILRPGIVFGPRSFWIASFADELLRGEAYLMDGGRGICNSIYVDNLIHAIRLAVSASRVDGESFIVGDDEKITWADLYRPVTQALGFDLQQIPDAVYTGPHFSWKGAAKQALAARPSRAVLDLMPRRLRFAVRSVLRGLLTRPRESSPWSLSSGQRAGVCPPVATLERALLYGCRYKLPDGKARRLLGYRPIVSFAEGCQRSVDWLASAGYPVREAAFSRSATRRQYKALNG
jgi:nucleoside-diphosphate-sugar epimerase